MLRALIHSEGSVSCYTELLSILIIIPQNDQEIVEKPAAVMLGKGVEAGESKDQRP